MYYIKNNFKIISTHNTEVITKYHNELENDNNNINNNCKSKGDCQMGRICNLKSVVYQATIFPKENVKDKKFILEFCRSEGN